MRTALAWILLFSVGAVTADPGVTGPEPLDSLPLEQRDDIVLVGGFSGEMKGRVPRGWELDDKESPIDIALTSDGTSWAVRLSSRDSAFGVYRELDFEIRDYPWLNWEWKVEELPAGGDFRDSATDDQAGQVYVSFGSLSFFNKPFVRALGYYWSSTAPVGTEGPCPTWGKSRAVVLRSGAAGSGEWVRERRNVYRDYVRLFQDDEPSSVSAVRLYTNSQHTESGSVVSYRNIYFSRD